MASEGKTEASTKGLVVVTGASSGIGAAIAQAFSAAGHPLLLLSRRVEPMEALALPQALCKSVDVSDEAAFVAAVAEGEAAHGPVEVMVNNAGCMMLSSALEKQASSEWDAMIAVNIKGVLNGMKAVLAGMKERKSGTIVNVSSIAGIAVFDNHAVYCGVKYACSAMTEAVRRECSSYGVRVVCVEPGVVETPLLTHTKDEAVVSGYKEWKAGELKGEPLRPEDVARVVVFAAQQPPHVCLREIVIGPTFQKQ